MKKDTLVRIRHIAPGNWYAKYARLFVGRLMVFRCQDEDDKGSTTGWYEFRDEKDRKAVNDSCGWSDGKRRYLLESPEVRIIENRRR